MEKVFSSNSKSMAGQMEGEKKPRPRPGYKVNCPRCNSGNTKFCYYNNYSMAQPRYFCKGCRRYWTQGGSLRSVPVGGGCRRSKRPGGSDAHKLGASSSSKPTAGVPPLACTGMNFPNIAPTFMPAGFELPSSLSLATFASSLSNNPAAVMPPGGSTSSFLDVLRGGAGGLLDDGHRQNNDYYYGRPTAGSDIGMLMTPPPESFGIPGPMQQDGGLAIGGNGNGIGATAATFHGGTAEEGDNGAGGMMELQWEPQDGNGGGGGDGPGGAEHLGTGNSVTPSCNNNNNHNGGGGGDDDDGGSSRDYYSWSNNGGSNPWQSLINSSSLM